MFPNACPSTLQPLQAVQNAALRIASGAVLMSSQEHLHNEAELLPVECELSMLCRQFLLRALLPGHPSNAVVSAPPDPRSPISDPNPKFQSQFQSPIPISYSNSNLQSPILIPIAIPNPTL